MRIHTETPVLTEAIVIGKRDYVRMADLALEALSGRVCPAAGNVEALEVFDRKLGRAIITDDPVPATTIAVGSTATIRDPDTGHERTLTLVWPGEERAPDHVSVFTPCGSALLGLSPGHRASYPAPDGRIRRLVVLTVHGPTPSVPPID